MNIGHLSTALSLGLALWSGSSLALTDYTVQRPQRPSLADSEGEPAQSLSAELSHIAEFKAYNVNNLNPFVPFSVREIETKKIETKKNKPMRGVKPPVVKAPVKQEPLPLLVLPIMKVQDIVVPRVIGVVRLQDRFFALVKIGNDEQQMTSDGKDFKGWVLKDMINELAIFIDPDGEELEVPVGMNGHESNVISVDAAAQAKPAAHAVKPTLPPGLDINSIMEMMNDPAQAPKLMKMAQDPRYKDLLSDPAIRELLKGAMAGER